MAAKRRKTKIKNGYMIDVNFRGRISFQTYETSAEAANEIVRQCNNNLLLIQTGNLPWDNSWSKPEKLHLFRFGKIHPYLEIQEEVDEKANLTFENGFDIWRSSLDWKNPSEATRKDYERRVLEVGKFFKSIGLTKIKDLKRKHLNELISYLNSLVIPKGNPNAGSPYHWKTIKNYCNFTKQNLIWLKREDHISEFNKEAFQKLNYGGREKSSYEELDFESYSSRLQTLEKLGLDADHKDALKRSWYSENQLIHHLDFLKSKLWLTDVKQTRSVEANRRLFCAVVFAIYTGSRRVEVARACLNHIDWKNGQITFWRKKGKKRHQEWNKHTAPIHSELIEYLQYACDLANKKGQQSLFTASDKHIISATKFHEKKTINKADSLSDALKGALSGTEYGNIARWHIYRHTLCSILCKKQVPPKLVQDLIGWRTDEIMKLYSHADDRDLRDIQQLISLECSQNVHEIALDKKKTPFHPVKPATSEKKPARFDNRAGFLIPEDFRSAFAVWVFP